MRILILIMFLVFNQLYAGVSKEMVLGKTSDFAERDMLELIQEHIQKNKAQIEQKSNSIRDKAKEDVKNYKPNGLVPLESALEDRVFYPDLTYILDKDIKDHNGKVLYKKGFKFNPADYVKMSYALIIINGDNKNEVEWFKTSAFANKLTYRLLLSSGSFYELNKELKQEVYYLMPEIRTRFQIQRTPSIVKQIGNKIEVKEFCITCNENNQTKDK